MTQPLPETNPAPQAAPPANPPTPVQPPPAAPTAPLQPIQQSAPNVGGDLAAVLQQMGQSIASIPEKVADAVREQTPNPPAPPTPAGTDPANPAGAAATKKTGGKVANWWFGN